MDASTLPPVASAPTASTVGVPPRLGTPVPGTTGGLPSLGGLSVNANPMAQQLQSAGRGEDTMLVHMTPGEVNSLQGLAMANGGSLTINPETGLPEAGILGKILPMALGALGMAFGIPPVWMGALGAVGGTAVTGSLKQGLMAGLGAYGGASLAGAAGVGGALGNVGTKIGLPGAANIGGIGATQVTSEAASKAATLAGQQGAAQTAASLPANLQGFPELIQQGATQAAQKAGAIGANQAINIGAKGLQVASSNTPGFLGQFGQAARLGLPDSGIIGQAAPMAAGAGLLGGVSNALTPTVQMPGQATPERTYAYEGGYTQAARPVTFYNDVLNPSNSAAGGLGSTAERMYFPSQSPAILNQAGEVTQPGFYNPALQGGTPYNYVGMRLNPEEETGKKNKRGVLGSPTRLNDGGVVEMQDGGFVMPARETAEFGNGSTGAGHRALAGMGGIPIRGAGDGVSDSIPARIGGDQEARVADGETYFPPQAVRRLGGSKKLYTMMKQAQDSRKRAPVGGTASSVGTAPDASVSCPSGYGNLAIPRDG